MRTLHWPTRSPLSFQPIARRRTHEVQRLRSTTRGTVSLTRHEGLRDGRFVKWLRCPLTDDDPGLSCRARTAADYQMTEMRWTAAARASEVAGSTRPFPAAGHRQLSGELKIIAAISERPVIEEILTHLGDWMRNRHLGRRRACVTSCQRAFSVAFEAPCFSRRL